MNLLQTRTLYIINVEIQSRMGGNKRGRGPTAAAAARNDMMMMMMYDAWILRYGRLYTLLC